MNKTVKEMIYIPVVAILGIYIVGVLIQELFDIPNAVKYLFWAVGGIGFFAYYFRSKIKKS